MRTGNWNYLNDEKDLLTFQNPQVTPTAGNAIGIITVNLKYPKLPGNVANATTFKFPVDYEVIDIDINLLFKGDPQIKKEIIDAAKRLEKRGVRAIVGACGYFANFQKIVRDAVDVPVFMSSLMQIPLIKTALKDEQKVAVFVASYENINSKLFSNVNVDENDCVVYDIGSLDGFYNIKHDETTLDNNFLNQQLVNKVKDTIETNDEIGAILLECSDLPPYSYAIQAATNYPVFDFITLINFVYHSVVQKPYYGYF